MNRREFIAVLGGAAALPLAARAQQPAVPVVGYLTSWSPDTYGQRTLLAFRQGLAEAGFSEDKNVQIEVRWGEGHYDRMRAMAADLVHRQVRVIATSTTSATIAAKAETTTIPIVFSMAGDPVALGLIANLARPGGNVTGATQLTVELAPKRLQLLHELFPAAASMALLVNSANAAVTEPQQLAVEAAAHAIGLKLHVLNASDERGIADAFAAAFDRRAGGLVIAVDAFFTTPAAKLGALTLRHRVPTIYTLREFVAAGGLMGYSGNTVDNDRIVGLYVGRILKGQRPADLPVQQSTKIELLINLKTAKALGLTIPPTLLARADEVIE